MKSLCRILAISLLSVAGCKRGNDTTSEPTPAFELHRNTISKFQDGQKRFQVAISSVRDEESFDAGKGELNQVVTDWREVAVAMSGLEPPSSSVQMEFRELLAEGNRATEPTGEDMLSLTSIEGREDEVTHWLIEFAEAGRSVGVELERLYGPLGHSAQDP